MIDGLRPSATPAAVAPVTAPEADPQDTDASVQDDPAVASVPAEPIIMQAEDSLLNILA
jgi:hypothetical protein